MPTALGPALRCVTRADTSSRSTQGFKNNVKAVSILYYFTSYYVTVPPVAVMLYDVMFRVISQICASDLAVQFTEVQAAREGMGYRFQLVPLAIAFAALTPHADGFIPIPLAQRHHSSRLLACRRGLGCGERPHLHMASSSASTTARTDGTAKRPNEVGGVLTRSMQHSGAAC